jgi:glycosyltransferase involved in cell wall biosynthesis
MGLSASVALTTYNGEKYIIPQLESLLGQTRLPDEVIICDDGSTDSTIRLVRRFIDENGLNSSWLVFENLRSKGVTKNFIDCARMTSGNLIFFSDQDDVWNSVKIEMMSAAFEEHSDIDAVGCHLTWADSAGVPLHNIHNMLMKNDHRLHKVSLAEQVRDNQSAGLTLAFRRQMLPELERIVERHGLTHDLPLGLICAAQGTYCILNEALVAHRVHEENASAPQSTLAGRLRDLDYCIRGRKVRLELMQVVVKEYGSVIGATDRANLLDAVEKAKVSILDLERGNLWGLFKNLFDMNPMSNRLLLLNSFLCALTNRHGAPQR